MKVLLIVPAYNEELNIENTINIILKEKEQSKHEINYVVINDGSKDDTEKICREHNYNIISLIANLGIGGAVQTGYKYALEHNYDVAIQFDGDGQHDISYLDNLVDEIQGGYDFVIGSRFLSEKNKFKSTYSRRIGIRLISTLIKICTGQRITDPTSGFRAANKKVIKLFSMQYPTEYPEPESIVKLITKKMKINEIPVEMHERKYGKSSIKPLKGIYYMFSVCISIMITSVVGGKNEY